MTASAYPDSPRGLWPVAPPKRDTPIGAAIRQWRTAHRVTQGELARRLDLSPSFITRIESGERDPDIDAAPVIAEVLGMDERDVALLIAGFDPVQYRAEIEAAERGRIVSAVQGALEAA